MRRKNRTPDSLINRLEIESAARLLRKVARVHNRSVLNIDELTAALKTILPQLRIRVVEDCVLPNKVDARAFPRRSLIKIRRGIKEGLLRGDGGARWTLAHELGHVVLQHARHPFRTRYQDTKRSIDRTNERAADIFASELLTPRHLARNYQTADHLRAAFQVSTTAAKFTIREITEEDIRNNSPVPEIRRATGEYKARSAYLSQLEDATAQIYLTVSNMIGDWNANSPLKVEALKNNLIGVSALVAVGTRLLCEAYQSFRREHASSEYANAAALAAALLFIRPIREIRPTPTMSKEVKILNQQCALKIAAASLNITLENVDRAYLRDSDHIGVRNFDFYFLSSVVEFGTSYIDDTAKLPRPTDFPTYERYNANYDLCWDEIHSLEDIIDIFLLFKAAQARRMG